MGTRVVTADSDDLGRVHDVMLVQDGPHGAHGSAGLRLHAFAVGKRSLGTQLADTQGTLRGPWPLRKLFSRSPLVVPWTAIVDRNEERIVVDHRP